ncbi:dihydrolipoyl dehydrogenase family protein [Tomitella fengzijianii]|uniref:NAD(P)/FAD-dependent oxidoreductase n=1 Tax=Tomitella fengzijianii TaxID=2597660 RepID=A0A516X4L7_9ACTN|nr:NAD(P)/FAD-dependent oxidoreductase [Tomitella fengzijianii]QDQ98025.1 NAD(P)/FAD-dependent oxidoreductase [Tomitella fengzijianii]
MVSEPRGVGRERAVRECDVVVLGGGPAGENAAAYAVAGSDRTATIVEPELVGGECSYWACIPSKVLLHPAAVRGAASALPGVTGLVGDRPLDAAAVLARRDSFIGRPDGSLMPDDSGQVRWARGAGIDVVRGAGRLVGQRTVEVVPAVGDGGATVIEARHAVVLATGSEAALPPTPGLAEARPWTSRDVTAMTEVPGSVAIIGGGVVACEAATWLSALGSEVTMIVRGGALLGGAEPFAGALVADALRQGGPGRKPVRILFGTQAYEAERDAVPAHGPGVPGGAPVTLRVEPSGHGDAGGSAGTVSADEVVVAAGRRPAVRGLGLEAVGLDPRHPPRTDAHMAVPGVAGLYAVGDVTGRAPLTHMGKYQARVCGDVIAARAEGRPVEASRFHADPGHTAVPQVVFTDPQAAWTGLTEARARAAGIDAHSVSVDLGAIAGAALQREGYTGRAQLVVDRARGVLVGATFAGPEVAELLHAATIAVVGEVPLDRLWHAVPAFPTVSEAWLRLLEAAREAGLLAAG